jgi:hypothetical protein
VIRAVERKKYGRHKARKGRVFKALIIAAISIVYPRAWPRRWQDAFSLTDFSFLRLEDLLEDNRRCSITSFDNANSYVGFLLLR